MVIGQILEGMRWKERCLSVVYFFIFLFQEFFSREP